MGGRHGATRLVNRALKNQARVRRTPISKLQNGLALNRVELRTIPYSKFAVPGQTVRIAPIRSRGSIYGVSGTTVDHALKVHRMLAKGPDARRPFIPNPGNVGKSKRGFKK